jgi:hypothetical protein
MGGRSLLWGLTPGPQSVWFIVETHHMFLCYIDESGHTGPNLDDPRAPFLVIAGVLVNEDQWRTVSTNVRTVIRRAADLLHATAPALIRTKEDVRRAWTRAAFSGSGKTKGYRFSRDVEEIVEAAGIFLDSPRFELHATDLVNGHGMFFGTDPTERTKLVSEVVSIVVRHKLPLLYSVVDKAKLKKKNDRNERSHPDSAERVGMDLFVSGLETMLRKQQAHGIMICDNVDNPGDHRARLARSQADGSPMFGVQHVIETVHFLDSHTSPMLQLVDVVTYLVAQEVQETNRLTRERARLLKLVAERRFGP